MKNIPCTFPNKIDIIFDLHPQPLLPCVGCRRDTWMGPVGRVSFLWSLQRSTPQSSSAGHPHLSVLTMETRKVDSLWSAQWSCRLNVCSETRFVQFRDSRFGIFIHAQPKPEETAFPHTRLGLVPFIFQTFTRGFQHPVNSSLPGKHVFYRLHSIIYSLFHHTWSCSPETLQMKAWRSQVQWPPVVQNFSGRQHRRVCWPVAGQQLLASTHF